MGLNLSFNLNPFKIAIGTGGSGGKKSIMSQTVANQVRRLRQDVGKWRNALDKAENVYFPDRLELYNIYADVVLDLHLTAIMQSRINAVLRRPFKIQDGKEVEQPALARLLRKPWFYKFCTYALEKNFYGHSLIEFPLPTPAKRDADILAMQFADCELVPRQYVSPELGIVRSMPGMIVGTDFRADPSYSPWLIEVGEATDLGLLCKVAVMALYKKNVVAAWADFTEIFGMPFRSATTEAEGDDLDKIEQILADMGQNSYGVFPEDVDIKFITAPTANERLYDTFIERANSELSKGVLGQTMTTDAGSSRSQSEVHERTAEAYTQADSDFLASLINEQLLPFLQQHGYPVQGCEFVWDTAEQLPKPELFKIVQGIMKDSGYQLNKAWLEKTFGVELEEKPAPPAALLPPGAGPRPGAPGAPTGQADDEQEGEAAPGKSKGSPAESGSPTAQLQALYGSTSCCTVHSLAAASAAAAGAPGGDDELASLWDRLVRVVYAGAGDGALLLDLPLFEFINERLQHAVEIAWNAPDPALKKYLKKNVQRFSGFKTHKVCQELTRKLYDSDGKIVDFEAFKQEAASINTLYNEAYLKTEYEQAVASAQMASKWATFGPDDLLQYRTVGDDLVRPEHKLFDKVTLPASHPWWKTHYPPNDWNCRCDAVDLVDGDEPHTSVERLIDLPEVPDLFAHNVGAEGEIFGPEHPYFDVPKATAVAIDKQLKLNL